MHATLFAPAGDAIARARDLPGPEQLFWISGTGTAQHVQVIRYLGGSIEVGTLELHAVNGLVYLRTPKSSGRHVM